MTLHDRLVAAIEALPGAEYEWTADPDPDAVPERAGDFRYFAARRIYRMTVTVPTPRSGVIDRATVLALVDEILTPEEVPA